MAKNKIIWTLKEITQLLRQRQLNEYDANFAISGKRGDGKSTLAFKIFNSFRKEGFDQKKHQVYSQDDVVKLLSKEKFGFCWDDEAINSGYKRDFQSKGQKILIKIVTNYRDNFNIQGSALPFFTSLDKDLRALIFIHFHIVQRGVAAIFMPLETQIFGDDQWDIKNNSKIEDQENKRIMKNPEIPFRFHRFSTFVGYLYFGDMTPKQRRIYNEIKKKKRGENFGLEGEEINVPLDFNQKMYNALVAGNLTKEFLQEACLIEGKKYSAVSTMLNIKLKDNGMNGTLRDFFKKKHTEAIQNKRKDPISDLIPDF